MGNKLIAAITGLIATFLACFAVIAAPVAPSKLPIPDGAWVDEAKSCGSASAIYVFNGNRLGLVQINDPNYPLDGRMNVMEKLANKAGGFIEYDQGRQIKSLPNGQALMLTFYPTSLEDPTPREGARETIRQCTLASLPLRARAMVELMLTGSASAEPGILPARKPSKLPIADGVWIESKFACNSETDAYLFNGGWNAEIDFWDPVLPPMAYVSDILRVKAKTGGFTSFNDSRQIKILADGQAIIREIDPGATEDRWTKTVRQCAPSSLSPRVRPLVEPLLAGAAIPTNIPVQPATAPKPTSSALPIADGAWVSAAMACNKADRVIVFKGNQYGDFYYYGPNLSMGPDGGLEAVEDIESKGNGFIGFNRAFQVKPGTNGQAILRVVGYDGPASNPGPLKELSRDTLRLCTPDSLPPRMRAKIAPLLSSSAVPSTLPKQVAVTPSAPAGLPWVMQETKSGRTFANSPAADASGLKLSLSCDGGRPIAALEIPGQTAKTAFISISTVEGRASQSFNFDSASKLYVGYLTDNNFVSLLAGNSGFADLEADSKPRNSRLSLAGSTQAITTALRACWKPVAALRPTTITAGAQAKPTSAANQSAIPLAVGYYAYVEGSFSTCAKPVITPWYFDGVRFWEESDVTDPKHEFSSQALKWEMAGADRFRITYRNRDENGRWDSQQSVNEYVLTGPQSFTFVGTVGAAMGYNEKHQLCSTAQLPAKSRWYKAAK